LLLARGLERCGRRQWGLRRCLRWGESDDDGPVENNAQTAPTSAICRSPRS
jgi:hypothetical protein